MSTHASVQAFPAQGWADVVGKVDNMLGQGSGLGGLALIDVDRFTDLTQRLSPHGSPAAIASTIESRLAEFVGPNDITALVTDDLFVIARPDLDGPAAMEGLGLRLVDRFQEPLSIGNTTFECTVSVGVSISRRGDTGKALLRYAQFALDDAKALGRNQMVAFADEDRELLSDQS